MKIYIVTIVFFSCFLFYYSGISQTNQNVNVKGLENITCDHITYTEGNDTLVLVENVSFESKTLKLINAEKVFLDTKNKRMQIVNPKEFEFDGKIEVSHHSKKETIIYYDLSENILEIKVPK